MIMTTRVFKDHEFHDPDYAKQWAEQRAPNAERLKLFDLIFGNLAALNQPKAHIVELGIGPGYLAHHLLSRMPHITYEGLDFSAAMLEVARGNLSAHLERVTFTQADLTTNNWTASLSGNPNAIVSTWALHDLGSADTTASVYAHVHEALPPGGVFLNGDFIKPDGSPFEFEPGRYELAKHLQQLNAAGFADIANLGNFETELENPTPAQNYVCLFARRANG